MSLGSEGVPFTMPVQPAGSSNNNGNSGGWGGDWSAWIIIFVLFFAFGGWGNGFGGGWGNGNGAGAQGALTRADICSEFAFNDLQNGVRGLSQGICDSTFALNNSINNLGMTTMQGFNGVNQGLCNLGYNVQQGFNTTQVAMMQGNNALQAQLASCCCGNEKGQMMIQNAVERGFCQTNYNDQANTNAIIQNGHNDTDRVLAKLDAMEMSRKDETIAALRSQVDALNLAQSQANQNNYLVNTLRPCPTPTYLTCNPWASQAPYGSCGTCGGCGC